MPHIIILEVFPSPLLFRIVLIGCVLVSFKCLVEFNSKAIRSFSLLCWDVYDYWLNLLTNYWPVQIFKENFTILSWYIVTHSYFMVQHRLCLILVNVLCALKKDVYSFMLGDSVHEQLVQVGWYTLLHFWYT